MATKQLVLTPKKGLTDPREPIPLDPDGVLMIGRAGHLRVHDPVVSVRHAEIYFEPESDRFFVRDLDSQSGTMVDGKCIRNEAHPIRAGTELRFGEAVVHVEYPRRGIGWAPIAGTVAALSAFSCLCVGVMQCRGSEESLVLDSNKRILLPSGQKNKLDVPRSFLMARGLSRDLEILDVTDYDGNEISEVWLRVGKQPQMLVVTFGEKDEWIELGLMPDSVRILRENSGSFPSLEGNGERWEFDSVIGKYRPIDQDGVVVWYRPKGKSAPAPAVSEHGEGKASKGGGSMPGLQPLGPLKVARLSLKEVNRLGKFMIDRSVYRKVHYLICESTFADIRAQMLTDDGQVLEMQPGCIDELRLEGKIVGKPYAIAFTPAGLRALVDDVTTFYAGDPSGLFFDEDKRKQMDALFQEPGALVNGARLTVITEDGGVPLPDPQARKSLRIEDGPHPLAPTDEWQFRPAPHTRTFVLSVPGDQEVAVGEGRCEKFRVTLDQDYDKLEIYEIGCTGTPVQVLSTDQYHPQKNATINGIWVRTEMTRWGPIVDRDRDLIWIRWGYQLPAP